MDAIAIKQGARRLVAVSLAAAVMLCGFLIHSASANAGVFGFCNVNLPGYGACETGTWVGAYQDYGWGENHSVCVWLRPFNGGRHCSGGPNQGVYSDALPSDVAVIPRIENNAAGANLVHGVYLTH